MTEIWIAALGLFGTMVVFALTQRAAAHDRQRSEYAKALSLIYEWTEMPYRVHRRNRNEPDQILVNRFHELQEHTGFYSSWIAVESDSISNAYQNLLTSTRRQMIPHNQEAWKAEKPPSQNIGALYQIDVEAERQEYIKAVRRHFAGYGLKRIVLFWR